MGMLSKRNDVRRDRKAARDAAASSRDIKLGKKAPAHAMRRERRKDEVDHGSSATMVARTTGVLAAITLVAAFVMLVMAFMLPTALAAGNEGAAVSDAELADVPDQIAADGECDHAWVARLETIRHPQETHEVKHPAIYEESLVGHTVCNECGAVIDGEAAAHLEESGHSGYTTQVPVVESTLVSDEWTETVIDRDSWDETVQTGAECAVCGEKRG